MTTTTIRVSTRTRDTIHTLAAQAGVSMQVIVDAAVEAYRREQLLDSANAAYAALRADPLRWQALEAERAEWDGTIADGLDEGY